MSLLTARLIGGRYRTSVVHVSVTLVWFLGTLALGLMITDLGFVLELTGGFAATFLGFILPSACYLKLEPGPICGWEAFKNKDKVIAWFLLFFGFVAMIVSTSLTVSKLFTEEDGC